MREPYSHCHSRKNKHHYWLATTFPFGIIEDIRG